MVERRIVGFAFPLRRAGGMFPAESLDGVAIDDSIRQILTTSLGERPMRPNSGSRVWQMVFENVGPALSAMLATEVRRAIREQEKRVEVTSVSSEISQFEDGVRVNVRVNYRLAGRAAGVTVELDTRSIQ